MEKKTESFGEQHARIIRNIRKKSLESFIPDFFSMDEQTRIKHIFDQQSADYLNKLKCELRKHISNDTRRAYYENQIYRRIYDLVLK